MRNIKIVFSVLIIFVIFVSGCTGQGSGNGGMPYSFEHLMEYCEGLDDETSRDNCYSKTGTDYNRTEACNMVVNEEEQNLCLALVNEDETLCPSSSDPDACYSWVAQRADDISICEKIETAITRSMCEDLVEPMTIEQCDDDDPTTIDWVRFGRCVNYELSSKCSSIVHNCEINNDMQGKYDGIPCEEWIKQCEGVV